MINEVAIKDISEVCHILDEMWVHDQDGSYLKINEHELFNVIHNLVLKRLRNTVGMLDNSVGSDTKCMVCGVQKPNGCMCVSDWRKRVKDDEHLKTYWDCPSCGARSHASRNACRKCGVRQ